MIDRRFVLIVVALSILAGASQIVLWLTRPPAVEPVFAGPPRAGYTLDTFTLNALDEDGKLNLTISGPRLVRRGEDGSIFVTSPDYVLVDSDGHPWVGTSTSASVNKDGSRMQLEGNVALRRTPTADVSEATITTSDLIAWPKQNRIETAAPTRITQPGSILRGTGMRGDLDANVLELLSDVHNTFTPTRRKR